MRKYGRVQDGIIIEFIQTNDNIVNLFHPSLRWVEVDESVLINSKINSFGEITPPDPIVEPPTIPSAITRRQGRLMLLEIGKLLEVEEAISGIQDQKEYQRAVIEYEADTWSLDNSFLQSMWERLGGTYEELVELFKNAKVKWG